jgi:hypothetical protein
MTLMTKQKDDFHFRRYEEKNIVSHFQLMTHFTKLPWSIQLMKCYDIKALKWVKPIQNTTNNLSHYTVHNLMPH